MANQKPPNERTNEEVADIFIHYGRNYAYSAVYEMHIVAVRQIRMLEASLDALKHVEPQSEEFITAFTRGALKLQRVGGIKDLLAATVKRYAFYGPFDNVDYDPDSSRSAAVMELILADAEKTVDREDSTEDIDEFEEEEEETENENV